MITHTQKFEDLALAPIKQSDVKVVIQDGDLSEYSDGDIVWESSGVLMSVSIDAVGTFLGSTTKKAVVKLLGIVSTASIGDLFNIRLGLYDESELAFEYTSQGFFIVDTINYDYEAGSTTVTMYDHLWSAKNTLYKDAVSQFEFIYPCTVTELATKVCNSINVNLDPNFANLPNADYTITEDLYSNISNFNIQSVINEIASATGTTARISDTTLTFSQYDVSSENLDSVHLKKLTIGKQFGPVTSVAFGRIPQNDNIVIATPAPEPFEVTVDATANTFTSVGHILQTGDLIRVSSTVDLPEPLQSDANYFVSIVSEDVFSLAPTYADATLASNLIDLTSSGSGTITVSTLPEYEIKINNNEIVDDDRALLLPPVYNKLVGIEWCDVKATTTGLGWHEVGDVIQFTQDATTVRAMLLEIHLNLTGSVQEELVSVIPDLAAVDKQTAGGIIQSIYNTEIKTDKQAQEITSIVSRHDTLESETTENFSQVHQDIDDITSTFQSTGGSNLLFNSVGYATETLNLTPGYENYNWESGDYSDVDGTKIADAGMIRWSSLIKVYEGEVLKFNMNSNLDDRILLYSYDTDGVFIASEGQVGEEYTVLTGVGYVALAIFNADDANIPFTLYQQRLNTGELRPFTGVNSLTTLNRWSYNRLGSLTSATSPESMMRGALSGNQINLISGGKLTQRVTVHANTDTAYSLSFMARKGVIGDAVIGMTNINDSHTITIPGGEASDWTKYEITDITPTASYIDISIEVEDVVVDFSITDIMLNIGTSAVKWSQASGEILNTQVALNSDGITVKSSVYDGDYVQITPLEFAGYSDASGEQQKVFTLNRDTTVVQKLQSESQITMSPIKVIPVKEGDIAGWSFVKSGE